jgi:hypothetical protein
VPRRRVEKEWNDPEGIGRSVAGLQPEPNRLFKALRRLPPGREAPLPEVPHNRGPGPPGRLEGQGDQLQDRGLAHPEEDARRRGPPDEGEKKAHKKLRFRVRGAEEFDVQLYHCRGMVESVFGAEETDGHRLRTRFRKEENRERWGPVMAVGWNLKVLNRLRCGRILGMEVMPLIRN